MLVLFLVLNQIDAHVFQPIVVGKQVNLHPIAVILAVLIMGELFGLIGVIFAIPVAVVVTTLLDELTASNSLDSAAVKSPKS